MDVMIGVIAYIIFLLLFYNLFRIINKNVSLGMFFVLPPISLILSSILIKLIKLSKYSHSYTGDYWIWMITITIVSYSFLFSIYRFRGLYVSKPVKRHWLYYVSKKPYTTLYEGLTTPSWGKRIPSRYEVLEWKEKSKHFPPSISQWIILLITLSICIFELIIFLYIYTGNLNLSSTNITGTKVLETLKLIGTLTFFGIIFLLLLNRVVFFIVEFLQVIIENIINKSCEDNEWSKLVSFTLLFNMFVVLCIVAVVKLT